MAQEKSVSKKVLAVGAVSTLVSAIALIGMVSASAKQAEKPESVQWTHLQNTPEIKEAEPTVVYKNTLTTSSDAKKTNAPAKSLVDMSKQGELVSADKQVATKKQTDRPLNYVDTLYQQSIGEK